MKREQIINQYISVYEGHAMEKEELEISGFVNGLVCLAYKDIIEHLNSM